mmetsp:Transcript_14261/g.33772  ORF Transcript_14261/g.33772 Transcript_14261/m.33772 type:complete len:251 (+) Transcript_14261:896-1648(+)
MEEAAGLPAEGSAGDRHSPAGISDPGADPAGPRPGPRPHAALHGGDTPAPAAAAAAAAATAAEPRLGSWPRVSEPAITPLQPRPRGPPALGQLMAGACNAAGDGILTPRLLALTGVPATSTGRALPQRRHASRRPGIPPSHSNRRAGSRRGASAGQRRLWAPAWTLFGLLLPTRCVPGPGSEPRLAHLSKSGCASSGGEPWPGEQMTSASTFQQQADQRDEIHMPHSIRTSRSTACVDDSRRPLLLGTRH